MAAHNTTGKIGEDLAANWLILHDYQIIEQNWRFKNVEIDIIAIKHNMLHFIEVKTATSMKYGNPEEKVNEKKIKNMLFAADEYLHIYPQHKRIQFDVLAITMLPKTEIAYFLIEDIYM